MLRARKIIRKLEKRFIDRAGSAFAAAYNRSQASGQSVMISDQGCIYEVFPDGSRKWVKGIEPPTRDKPGRKISIL